MTCVYTGARVYFDNYGMLVSADLFVVGNTVVIKWEPESKQYVSIYEDHVEVTHTVASMRDSTAWHRAEIGVTVVHESLITGRLIL